MQVVTRRNEAVTTCRFYCEPHGMNGPSVTVKTVHACLCNFETLIGNFKVENESLY